ncbi:hypothetical protein PR048_028716 [Dryococelus australis]|uniref:General transcription factor II-I repeat domain-containing protein 2 n=1 Tax=Dryococelus australis TaxID=614101 RepID=A0ABQ9GBE8_9NEOP|nr:hypothetical protein PR048_028716 [Dryococelus australis]
MTVQRRIADTSNNLSEQFNQKANEFCCYSLAMDESTDLTYTAQLLIFVRGVDDNYEVTKELAGLYYMRAQTAGEEIANQVNKCVTERLGTTFKNLVAICINGFPSMCGEKHSCRSSC